MHNTIMDGRAASKMDADMSRMNDIQRGALLFQIKCLRCHPNKKDAAQYRGPNVWGLVGRKAASEESGYKKFTPELKKSGIFWTRESIKEYMRDPQRMVPGTAMFYGGFLPAEVQGDCIVTYMESISPGWEERVAKYEKSNKDTGSQKSKIKDLPAHPNVPLFGNEE